MYPHSMMLEQIALEAEMREATIARYYRVHDKAEEDETFADTNAGSKLLDTTYTAFLAGINAWVAEKKAGAAGRRPRAVRMIEEFGDTEAMAYIFLRHLINQTANVSKRVSGRQAKKTRVVLSCTQAIHDELRLRYFARERKALLKRIVKDFAQRELPRRRRRELMVRTFNAQKLEWQAEGWGMHERMNLGLVLLDIFMTHTGLVEEYRVYEGVKTIDCLAFTPKMVEAIREKMEAVSNLFTVFYPTVVPPRPWTNSALIGGGYYTDDVVPYRLIKGAKVKYLSEMENRDMARILRPINAIQETAWRVNPVMTDMLHYAFTNNLDVKGMPPADPYDVPPPPPGIDTDEELAANYRKECYLVHDTNRRSVSRRITVLRTISLANKFAKYPAIYFPHDLDSRGRAYAKPSFLNPQGPDYAKALLEFSEGKPIETEEHAAYLAVAIANAWGQDKRPLQDRVAWVLDNEEMLLEIARDPKSDLRWTSAAEPFMALRGALEWLGLADHGPGYLSHMPVHFDATCSGLQHFSALLRDAEGGFRVNLTSCEERQDIYEAVATKARATLAADGSDFAQLALQIGVTRAMCKRPVMIVPYAGTFSACMAYVGDYYKDLADEGGLPVPISELRKEFIPFVAKHIWEAISNTVIAARQAMDWITKTARVASANGQQSPIQWTTPDGFVVQQAKYEEKCHVVETYLDGNRRVRSTVFTPMANLDPRKMAQSLSPNYIHSLDASHLRMSVDRALRIGGMSFAMIHDSFGVHASDMARFTDECIKQAFIEMYEDGQMLERFRDEIVVNVAPEDLVKVKPLPSAGRLDIQDVQNSQFFFS